MLPFRACADDRTVRPFGISTLSMASMTLGGTYTTAILQGLLQTTLVAIVQPINAKLGFTAGDP